MKIGVIADTHGNIEYARAALKKLANLGAKTFVHLGDGLGDTIIIEKEDGLHIEKVSGNNEERHDLPDERLFDWGGAKILAIHGHRQDLNQYMPKPEYLKALTRLAEKARSFGAEIVLFAHTHAKEEVNIDGVSLLNPGALDLGTSEKTCLLIDLSTPERKATFLIVNEGVAEKP